MEDSIFYKYGIEDAESDGVLFRIFHVNPEWEKGIFSHITSNLLSHGYEQQGVINMPNLLDLLNQCAQLVRKQSDDYTTRDSKYSGKIELPNGEKQEVWICENEIGYFTIMLPEDY
jgi:hypothetical protein